MIILVTVNLFRKKDLLKKKQDEKYYNNILHLYEFDIEKLIFITNLHICTVIVLGKLKQLNNLLKTILGIAYVIYILFMNRIIKNGRPPMAHKSNADKKLNVRQKA